MICYIFVILFNRRVVYYPYPMVLQSHHHNAMRCDETIDEYSYLPSTEEVSTIKGIPTNATTIVVATMQSNGGISPIGLGLGIGHRQHYRFCACPSTKYKYCPVYYHQRAMSYFCNRCTIFTPPHSSFLQLFNPTYQGR